MKYIVVIRNGRRIVAKYSILFDDITATIKQFIELNKQGKANNLEIKRVSKNV